MFVAYLFHSSTLQPRAFEDNQRQPSFQHTCYILLLFVECFRRLCCKTAQHKPKKRVYLRRSVTLFSLILVTDILTSAALENVTRANSSPRVSRCIKLLIAERQDLNHRDIEIETSSAMTSEKGVSILAFCDVSVHHLMRNTTLTEASIATARYVSICKVKGLFVTATLCHIVGSL